MERQKDVIVKSIKDVDLTSLKFPQVAIYQHPDDWPENCIARVFDNGKPTNTIIVDCCVWNLQYDIEKNTNMIWLPRVAEDDTAIVGVYI